MKISIEKETSLKKPTWDPRGTHVRTMWVPCGILVGTTWEPYGNHVGTMWEPCGIYVRNFCGIPLGTMWDPCGSHVGPMWVPHDQSKQN